MYLITPVRTFGPHYQLWKVTKSLYLSITFKVLKYFIYLAVVVIISYCVVTIIVVILQIKIHTKHKQNVVMCNRLN